MECIRRPPCDRGALSLGFGGVAKGFWLWVWRKDGCMYKWPSDRMREGCVDVLRVEGMSSERSMN